MIQTDKEMNLINKLINNYKIKKIISSIYYFNFKY